MKSLAMLRVPAVRVKNISVVMVPPNFVVLNQIQFGTEPAAIDALKANRDRT